MWTASFSASGTTTQHGCVDASMRRVGKLACPDGISCTLDTQAGAIASLCPLMGLRRALRHQRLALTPLDCTSRR